LGLACSDGVFAPREGGKASIFVDSELPSMKILCE